MQTTQQITDEQFWARVEKARQMTGPEKIREGFRLFEEECDCLRQEFRDAHPQATEAEIRQMLSDRINQIREEEYQGIYRPLEPHEVGEFDRTHQ